VAGWLVVAKMEVKKNAMLWIAIGVLFLSVLFLTYKTSAIGKAGVTGASVTGNTVDTTGWTANEIMNYEMHGTIPARLQSRGGVSSASSGGTGMVGGC